MLRLVRYRSTRVPPKSLIVKQHKRLNKAPTDNSSLIISSLRDVGSLFQANSQTQDDDDLEQLNNNTFLMERLNAGELDNLLRARFGFDESTGLLSADAMVKNFPHLKEDELELLKKGNEVENLKPWSQIPNYVKQAQFYLSYGSYGPRDGIEFTLSERPADFTFLHRSKVGGPGAPYRKLKANEKVNLYTATPARQSFFNDKTLDPMSRFFIWSATAVSIAVGWQEYQRRNNGESAITVVNKSPI